MGFQKTRQAGREDEPKLKVGLEIHCYLNMEETKEKLFCRCRIDREAKPNTSICPVCTAQPGAKPMAPNKEAVEKIIKVALMLGCRVNQLLAFQRKHYDWPDLPAGYQRTMSGTYSLPVGENGSFLGVGIRDVHLEEDPAAWNPETGEIDYNRSGLPLAEIVTEPDFSSSEVVRSWLKELLVTLSYIRAVDRKAGVKCDVNVSVAPDYQRVEIKNVNSFSSIVEAIEAEAERQKRLVKEGKSVEQETRAFDRASKTTLFMRSKEDAVDYMFIPDPDLPAIPAEHAWIKQIKASLPPRPDEMKKLLLTRYKLGEEDADVLSREIALASMYARVAEASDPKLALTFVRREVPRIAAYNRMELDEVPVKPEQISEIVRLLKVGKISDSVAKKLLEKLFVESFDVRDYVEKQKLTQISDEESLASLCKEAIEKNQGVVMDYVSGKEESINYLVGFVMKETRGRADPKKVKKLLKELIAETDAKK